MGENFAEAGTPSGPAGSVTKGTASRRSRGRRGDEYGTAARFARRLSERPNSSPDGDWFRLEQVTLPPGRVVVFIPTFYRTGEGPETREERA